MKSQIKQDLYDEMASLDHECIMVERAIYDKVIPEHEGQYRVRQMEKRIEEINKIISGLDLGYYK